MKKYILIIFLFASVAVIGQNYHLNTESGVAYLLNVTDTANIDSVYFPVSELTYQFDSDTDLLRIWHMGHESKKYAYKDNISNITINGNSAKVGKLGALLNISGKNPKTNAAADAFSRMRVSNPQTLFDAQLTYGLQPLLYEQITSGTGATVTHDATNRNALMTFSNTPENGSAIMQTYEHFRYQPSKSQLIFLTFNMREAVAGCDKFAGYSDGTNSIIDSDRNRRHVKHIWNNKMERN